MSLDLFKKNEGVSEEDLHPKFKLLRDEITLQGERDILAQWTNGFIDRDNKIVKEFQTTFHSSFWEFYLFSVFREMSFEIDFSKDRPDFIIKKPIEIFIEAVVSNIKKEGIEESERNSDDVLSMIVPPNNQKDFFELTDEAIVRNSNAIHGKSVKYLKKYINCEWVNENVPFMIALSSYDQINYGREYFYPMLALLYGYYFIPKIDNYVIRESIIKPGTDSPIPIGIFKDKSFEHISAIIFSCTTTLGKLTSLSISEDNSDVQFNRVINIRNDYEPPHYKIQDVTKENPEYLSDGLFIFHNPNAKNKINYNQFESSNATQVTFEDGNFRFEGENTPIYSRLNLPKFMLPDEVIEMIMMDFNCK
ncbi:hypothetical protein [Flavobacterium maritimum]|uniref:hypothetical protein n=1 Tax=Flavobacterium maritimum TaxID=3149042 RepID=UPI0032B4FA21